MSARVAILVPVLGRPERVDPLYASVVASIPDEPLHRRRVAVHFLASAGDTAQHQAVDRLMRRPLPVDVGFGVMKWEAGPGDYARKLNTAYRDLLVDAELYDWALLAADDLHFHPGWLDAALACHAATGACVIGTNDLGNANVVAGRHSTHTLVHARYAECGTIDEDGKILHEGYDHNFVDNEFVGTAMFRETYAHATDCRIEHLHPAWRKGDDDATYRKGQRRFADDRALFNSRRGLWGA